MHVPRGTLLARMARLGATDSCQTDNGVGMAPCTEGQMETQRQHVRGVARGQLQGSRAVARVTPSARGHAPDASRLGKGLPHAVYILASERRIPTDARWPRGMQLSTAAVENRRPAWSATAMPQIGEHTASAHPPRTAAGWSHTKHQEPCTYHWHLPQAPLHRLAAQEPRHAALQCAHGDGTTDACVRPVPPRHSVPPGSTPDGDGGNRGVVYEARRHYETVLASEDGACHVACSCCLSAPAPHVFDSAENLFGAFPPK